MEGFVLLRVSTTSYIVGLKSLRLGAMCLQEQEMYATHGSGAE